MTDRLSSGAPASPLEGPFDAVFVGPHPDDVELFCGGLVASLVDRGHRVAIVDLTRGERASRGTPDERAVEAAAAAQVLGVAHRENCELPDAGLDPSGHLAAQLDPIVRALRRLQPEVLVVPWERERHPDHAAASALVVRASFLAGLASWAPPSDGEHRDPASPSRHVVEQILYYPMRELTEPTFVVDVTQAYSKKTAAIARHRSQVGPGPGETLVASPLSLPSLEARDRFYGAQIGVAYGEPYVARQMLGLCDPIAHFRANRFARPLFFPRR